MSYLFISPSAVQFSLLFVFAVCWSSTRHIWIFCLSVCACLLDGHLPVGHFAEPECVCLHGDHSQLLLCLVAPPRQHACVYVSVLDRWMMYYVKQSDPNNGLLSCLHAHTHAQIHKNAHFHSHTLLLTHTHTESLDSLSVIELWRGSAVTTSITHPGEEWRESERKAK